MGAASDLLGAQPIYLFSPCTTQPYPKHTTTLPCHTTHTPGHVCNMMADWEGMMLLCSLPWAVSVPTSATKLSTPVPPSVGKVDPLAMPGMDSPTTAAAKQPPPGGLCGCLSIQYYQPVRGGAVAGRLGRGGRCPSSWGGGEAG